MCKKCKSHFINRLLHICKSLLMFHQMQKMQITLDKSIWWSIQVIFLHFSNVHMHMYVIVVCDCIILHCMHTSLFSSGIACICHHFVAYVRTSSLQKLTNQIEFVGCYLVAELAIDSSQDAETDGVKTIWKWV